MSLDQGSALRPQRVPVNFSDFGYDPFGFWKRLKLYLLIPVALVVLN